jgi:hypothetical protein
VGSGFCRWVSSSLCDALCRVFGSWIMRMATVNGVPCLKPPVDCPGQCRPFDRPDFSMRFSTNGFYIHLARNALSSSSVAKSPSSASRMAFRVSSICQAWVSRYYSRAWAIRNPFLRPVACARASSRSLFLAGILAVMVTVSFMAHLSNCVQCL